MYIENFVGYVLTRAALKNYMCALSWSCASNVTTPHHVENVHTLDYGPIAVKKTRHTKLMCENVVAKLRKP